MKVRLLGSLAAIGLMLALAFPAVAPAAPPANHATPAVSQPTPGERHPEIRAAIGALKRAKAHMQEAKHDFGGHRVAALKACDEAIEQLQQALQFDKD